MKRSDRFIINSFIISFFAVIVCFVLFLSSTIHKNNLESKLHNIKDEISEKEKQMNELNEEYKSFDNEENKELEKEYENWKRQNEKLIDVLS